MQAAADHSATRLDEFATQAVSNIVWGCATMNFYHDKFIEAAAVDITSASQFLATLSLPRSADVPLLPNKRALPERWQMRLYCDAWTGIGLSWQWPLRWTFVTVLGLSIERLRRAR